MYRATSFCEREKSSNRSVMKSERLLRAGWALVAVRATAADFAARPGCLSWSGPNVVGSLREPRRGASQAQPEHDRLRPAAGLRRPVRARPDPAAARPRGALSGRTRALPALRSGLAALLRSPSGRLSAQPLEGLVGALLAARDRAGHGHH